ncbi:MAG: aldo/keto reductase [Stellaceae bacterium]
MEGFETRQVGRTPLRLTVLGLGTGTLGGHRIPVTRHDAEAVVGAAWSAGVRYFDTAPFYGFGKACRVVGDALRDLPREDWVLSTKAGRLLRPQTTAGAPGTLRHPMPFEDVFDYSYDGIMRSFEDSLQRLGLARIDILYVHDIGARQHGKDAHPGIMRTLRDSGYRALERLRASRQLGAIGIGVNEWEVLLEATDWGDWDVFLLAGRYTLLEQTPLDELLPQCLRSGISVVVGAPFNTGILAGRDTWNYRPAPSEILRRVKRIRAICDSHKVPLVAAALQFPLAHPAVAAILPGPRNVDEFETNAKLLQYPIPPALWADLRNAELLHRDAPTPA